MQRLLTASFLVTTAALTRSPTAYLPRRPGTVQATAPWSELEAKLPAVTVAPPVVVDSVLFPTEAKAVAESDGIVLFRERNGWCPYSERAWLALEGKGCGFSTVLIDNMGGGRPSWYRGTTPSVKWASGRMCTDSLDVLKEIDDEVPGGDVKLWPSSEVADIIAAFRQIFPRSTRPSSRAAFLFRSSGAPVFKKEFEATLSGTDDLLAQTASQGPFFLGDTFTAADIAWAPFLERYSAQLPVLHEGLVPRDAERWPHLARWYDAMESVPSYSCRCQGDAASWRKVLAMAGYGNAGVVPEAALTVKYDASGALSTPQRDEVWESFAQQRPHVSPSPAHEVAATLVRNRGAIIKDAAKHSLLEEETVIDAAVRSAVTLLLESHPEDTSDIDGNFDDPETRRGAKIIVDYLVDRVCVPRDMGRLQVEVLRLLQAQLAET